MATDYNYENKKARNQKLLPDKQLKKKVRKKAIKKVAGKVASRAIPVSYTHLTLPTNREV